MKVTPCSWIFCGFFPSRFQIVVKKNSPRRAVAVLAINPWIHPKAIYVASTSRYLCHSWPAIRHSKNKWLHVSIIREWHMTQLLVRGHPRFIIVHIYSLIVIDVLNLNIKLTQRTYIISWVEFKLDLLGLNISWAQWLNSYFHKLSLRWNQLTWIRFACIC
jgi:hypothetical protein